MEPLTSAGHAVTDVFHGDGEGGKVNVCVCVWKYVSVCVRGCVYVCFPRPPGAEPRGTELRDMVGMGKGSCHYLLLLEGSRIT